MNQNNPPEIVDLLNGNADLENERDKVRYEINLLIQEGYLLRNQVEFLENQTKNLSNQKSDLMFKNKMLEMTNHLLNIHIMTLNNRQVQGVPLQNRNAPPQAQSVVGGIAATVNGLGNSAAAPIVIDVEDDEDGREQ